MWNTFLSPLLRKLSLLFVINSYIELKKKKEIKVKKNISSIVCEVIETLFFFVKHILNLKYAKQ